MLDKLTIDSFFSIIRLGINHPVNLIPDAIDWPSMQDLASKHGLSAIVLDGVQKLMDNGLLEGGRSMDVALKKKWIGSVIQNYEWKYEDYRNSIAQLAEFYNQHGYRMMVLKGYGLSLNYPIPQHRPCGDIDIWTFGQYREADRIISQTLLIPIDSAHHHHTTFSFNGYLVENHYDFVNVYYGHRNNSFEKVLKELAMDDSVKTEINGEIIYLPSANLNALFLLRHCMLHFASTEMSVRQIIDWGLFIENHTSEIDWPWFLRIIDEYHMMDFFHCLNTICMDDLGFDSSFFPGVEFDSNSTLKNRMLNDVLTPEFNEVIPTRVWQRILFKYRRWQANAWKQDLCYGDSRFKAFWSGVWGHLMKPGMI